MSDNTPKEQIKRVDHIRLSFIVENLLVQNERVIPLHKVSISL
jgi:hypothetical protein